MVGQEEVAAIFAESLKGVDGLVSSQAAGQVLPSALDADAVAHDPAACLLLVVEGVDCRGRDERALARGDIVLLEPSHGIFLIGALLIVVRHEHGHHACALLRFVSDVEADGLTLADAAVAVAGLDGIGYVDVRGRFLDEIAVDDLVDVGDIDVVLDNLYARLSGHSGVVPAESHLARALRVVVDEVADSLAVSGCFVLNIGA